MTDTLPQTVQETLDWSWNQFKPHYDSLLAEKLTMSSLDSWMRRWTHLSRLLNELYWRLYTATTVDTNDKQAVARFDRYLDEIQPPYQEAEHQAKKKLLESGLQPENYAVPLRMIQTETAIFREENLPLLSQIEKLKNRYDQIVGAQTVEWQGEEITLTQLQPVYQEPDRQQREKAFRLAAERWLADRQALNELWAEMLDLRQEMAHNAGYDNYTDYRWKELLRFDYLPADCARFREAIAEVVVPAASRRYAARRQKLGLDLLRPWDLNVDPLNRTPLRPYQTTEELIAKSAAIFQQVDTQLGEYFQIMQREQLLDLENRKGKAPGGYCVTFLLTERPFIFMNAVGLHDDVQTLLHEGGHAFHAFELAHLPYRYQAKVPMEFAEVASMGMELLAAPYLTGRPAGFYSAHQAARARVEHLESSLLFWPYMAVVDGFQHWAYANPQAARHAQNCDDRWLELWQIFMPDVDYRGLEDFLRTGWQRKLHIFQEPFYYVEYGLAQLGAVQVWKNALTDQAEAVMRYRQALSLGSSASLPELFQTAGARFAFDAETLRAAVNLIEDTLEELEDQQ